MVGSFVLCDHKTSLRFRILIIFASHLPLTSLSLEPFPLLVRYKDGGTWPILMDVPNSPNTSYARDNKEKRYNISLLLGQRLWFKEVPQLILLSDRTLEVLLVSFNAYRTVRKFDDGKYSNGELLLNRRHNFIG